MRKSRKSSKKKHIKDESSEIDSSKTHSKEPLVVENPIKTPSCDEPTPPPPPYPPPYIPPQNQQQFTTDLVIQVSQAAQIMSAPIPNYSVSPLVKYLDRNGLVSWNHLNEQSPLEHKTIRKNLKFDKNLDILQRLTFRVCYGRRVVIPVYVYYLSIVLGILTIIYGVIWGVISFIFGSISLSSSSSSNTIFFSSFSHSSYSRIFSFQYFIGGPIIIIGSVVIGTLLLWVGIKRRKKRPHQLIVVGIVILILNIIVGGLSIWLIQNVVAGVVFIVVLSAMAIFLIVQGKMAIPKNVLVKDDRFDVLCVAFLYKVFGENWKTIVDYANYIPYPMEKIYSTIDECYEIYKGELK